MCLYNRKHKIFCLNVPDSKFIDKRIDLWEITDKHLD